LEDTFRRKTDNISREGLLVALINIVWS